MQREWTDYLAATFLQGVVFFVLLWGGLRLVAAWRSADWLRQLPLVVPWWYLGLSGGAWALGSLAALAMWYTHHPWTPWALRALLLLFPLLWLTDRLVLTRAPFFHANFPFLTAATAVVVAVALASVEIVEWRFTFGANHE